MTSILKELRTIPGVGKQIANDLAKMGILVVDDLKGKDPELLYIQHNDQKGIAQDICMLYTFRCAVYFAETPANLREKDKLNWWYWMDKNKVDSKTKDKEIREKLIAKTQTKS